MNPSLLALLFGQLSFSLSTAKAPEDTGGPEEDPPDTGSGSFDTGAPADTAAARDTEAGVDTAAEADSDAPIDSGVGGDTGAACPDPVAAAEDEAKAQALVDEAEAARDRASFALENLVAMTALAVRAANEPAEPIAREIAELELEARLSELAADGVVDPALDPDVLGLTGIQLVTSADAFAAWVALDAALPIVRLHEGALRIAADAEVRAADRALLPWASCAVEVRWTPSLVVDLEGPVDEARLQNLEEGLDLLDAAITDAAVVRTTVGRIKELARTAALARLPVPDREAVVAEFSLLSLELEHIAATSSFHGLQLADGSTASVSVVTEPDAGGIFEIPLTDLSPTTLGIDSASIDLSTDTGGRAAGLPLRFAMAALRKDLDQYAAAARRLEVEASR